MWFKDKYWISAAEWAVRLAERCDYVLAPKPMQQLTPRCLPLEFSSILSHKHTYGLVCPKDSVFRLSLSWLEAIRTFKVIYADDVFAVMSTGEIPGVGLADEEEISRNLPYLWSKVDDVLKKKQARKNRVDEALTTAGPVDPYCLIINACLAGNAGEVLLAEAAREVIQQARPDLRCIVADPDIDRTLVAGASLVVIGPGGMLYDLVDHEELALDFQNVANYFRHCYIAREYNRPVCLLGIAQQARVISRTTLKYVRGAISDALFINTRDTESASVFIQRLGFENPVCVTPDVAVVFSDKIREMARRPTERRTIAVCGVFGVGTLVSAFSNFDGRVRLILQGKEDVAWFQQNEHALRNDIPNVEVVDVTSVGQGPSGSGGAEPFLEAVATTDGLLTSRFHAMMIALIAGIDTLVSGIANDKRHRVCVSIGSPPWVHFIDAMVEREEELLARAARVVAFGRRDPQRGCFDSSELDSIRQLLRVGADQSPALASCSAGYPLPSC